MTPREYIDLGAVYCPVCHSTNVDADPIEPDERGGTSKVTCFSCDSSWLDIYTITNIEMIKTGRQ